MAPLEHSVETNGARALVRIRGELDLAGAVGLEPELERLAAESAVEQVTVDLSELTFLDSSGLRLIVVSDARLRDAGRRLVLVPGPPHVMRVFALTRVEERLAWKR